MPAKIGNLFTMLYSEVQAGIFTTLFSAEEKLLSLYNEAYTSIITDIAGLYEHYSIEGKLTHAQMSKFNRLKNLEKQIAGKLHPDLRKSDEYIKGITGIVYEESFYHHAWAIDQDAGAAIKWGLLRDADIEAIVNSPLSKLSDSKNLIADRMQAVYQVRKAVTLGLVRGEGYPQMAKRIRDVIGISYTAGGKPKATGKGLLYKSTRIVRTEGQRAVVEGQSKAYQKAKTQGVQLKEIWDAALDSRTRPEHGSLDGKAKQEQGWYVPTIGWIPAPLQSGVASFDIHCRCRIRGEIAGYPPKTRGQKGNGQQPWVDYESWKGAVKQKGSAKSIVPPSPPKIADIPVGQDGAVAFGSRLQKTDKTVGGSTGAQVFIDDEGQEWIFKDYSGKTEQVRNEFIANQIYQKGGIQVAPARLAQIGDTLGVASKRLPETYNTIGWESVDIAAKAQKAKGGFAMDAFLSNWDVAGMSVDNLIWSPGKISTITRIDQGGTLFYRAQGGLKGSAFGSEVTELTSLRNMSQNKAAASLFKHVTDKDVAGQVITLKNRLNNHDILSIVSSSGLDNKAQDAYATLLIKRLDYLKKWERDYRKLVKGIPKTSIPSGAPISSSPAELRNLTLTLYDTLTPEEQTQMRMFTASSYRKMNSDALIGKFNTSLERGIDKLPYYDGVVGRGIENIPNIEEKFAKWKSGDWAYVQWKAYSSTSITPGRSFSSNKGYLAVIKAKGKNRAGYINGKSSFSSEDELLFSAGAKFQVTGYAQSPGGKRTLLLEEFDTIPDTQAPPKEMTYEEIMKIWKESRAR